MSDGARTRREVATLPGSVAALVDELAEVLAAGARFEAREALAEAREIVAALYDVPRFWPAANAHVPVEAEMWPRARAAAVKRARGAPLAYAVGRVSFRHLTLDIDEPAICPSPCRPTHLASEAVVLRLDEFLRCSSSASLAPRFAYRPLCRTSRCSPSCRFISDGVW